MTEPIYIFQPENIEYDSLLTAKSWTHLEDCIHVIATALGARSFILRFAPRHAVDSEKKIVSSLPHECIHTFLQQSEIEDPVERHFTGSSLPFAWTIRSAGPHNTASLHSANLRKLGLTDALSVIQRGNSFTSRADFFGTAPFSGQEHRARLMLLQLYMHDAAQAIWQSQTANVKAQLSTREIECLSWSAIGKTSREIGMILGFSRRTVYFHLTNVAAKLDVETTRHAISRAVSLGLLQS